MVLQFKLEAYMKKAFFSILVLALAISLSGCASMLKSMGGVTKAELAAQEDRLTSKIDSISAALTKTTNAIAEIEAIKSRLEDLSRQIENATLTAQEVEVLKMQLAQITADLEKISDTTLLNLAKLINDALSQTGATESK